MAEQALQNSVDPEEIKRYRKSTKTQVTTSVNRLGNILAKKDGNYFDHKVINETEVEQVEIKLKENFDLFSKLHAKYCHLRAPGKDETEEEELEEKDAAYSEEVSSKVYLLMDQLKTYHKSLANMKSIPSHQEKFEDSMMNFKVSKEIAVQVSQCLDNLNPDEVSEPAENAKKALDKDFDELSVNAAKLKKALVASGDTAEAVQEKVKFDRMEELKSVAKINKDLDKIVNTQKINASKLAASSPIMSSTFKEADLRPHATPIKLEKPGKITFSGNARDFATFKRNFEAIVVPNRPAADVGLHLYQAVPQKDRHLLDNVSLDKHQEMMKILAARFGTTRRVVDSIVSEIEKLKIVTTDKMFIEYVEKVERIKRDAETVNLIEEIANSAIISKLESKLPVIIYQYWTDLVVKDGYEKKSSKEKFEGFMKFLAEKREVVEYTMSDIRGAGTVRAQTQTCFVTGLSARVPTKPDRPDGSNVKKERAMFGWKPCLACNVDGATDLAALEHPMGTCAVWKSLSQQEKEKRVKCLKHPFKSDHTTQECTVKGKRCKFCTKDTHHFLLCPKKPIKSGSNVTKIITTTTGTEQSILPVMVQAQFVTGKDKSKIGTLMDLASTDDYVTHRYAKKKNLHGEDVELIVEGIGGKETFYHSKIYQVPIVDKNGVEVVIPCYGMEEISSVTPPPEKNSYHRLCEKFGVKPAEVRRPDRIELLISMRQNYLHPKSVSTVGGITLYDGRFGKVFGGSDPDLIFTPYKMSYPLSVNMVSQTSPFVLHHAQTMRTVVKEAVYTTTAKSDREFLEYFKEESIGAECVPRCGGCKCGKCPTGAKQMSIKDERDYDNFKSLMHLDSKGTDTDKGPYWVSSFPWIKDKTELVDNKPAVLGVMNSTLKKLSRDPTWKEIYEAQLLELVKRGFAREVTEEELNDWEGNGGKIYYIAHQMALNPGSKSTPVRVVFNSSQVYKGYSLNSSWELGPDVMNNLHGVLIRFREDKVGGQGDITKMFYMVRIPKEEQMMQLFLWQFPGEKSIKVFCMTRLVMGNKPSTNLSLVALKETAGMNDNRIQFPAAYQAILHDSYVDNLFVTAPDHDVLKAKIEEIEKVSAQGGFYYKEWIISGEDIPEQLIGVKLDDAIGAEEEKALGIYWNVKDDNFYVKANLEKPSKKPKKNDIKVEVEKIENFINLTIKPHLTLRTCLSLHAKAHDPLGLVLPVRMIGNLLFRNTLQALKKDRQGKIPWDEKIDTEHKEEWIEYFKKLFILEELRFQRCLKPVNVDPEVDPDLVTFNDGNPDAYGVVAYAVFTTMSGERSPCLVMSKAKLGPLSHKGETVRNELSGATLASRMKVWIMQESGLKFKNHFHFLDSMIVLDMMKRESYGFNTFAGLRVGEIQQKTDLDDWLHIPSQENIADILTKGASFDKLGPGSSWQCGPSWLSSPQSSWPVTPPYDRKTGSSNNLTHDIQSNNLEIKKFEKKSLLKSSKLSQSLVTGSVTGQCANQLSQSDDEIERLIERCGDLRKLVRCVAYILRIMSRGQKIKHAMSEMGKTHKWERRGKEILASEYVDAYSYLISWEQKKRLNIKDIKKLSPNTVMVKLRNYSIEVPHIMLGGRVKNFPVRFSGSRDIPIIPNGALAKLIILFYHNKHHRDVDTTVTFARSDVWVIKARKIASAIDAKCRTCLEKRAKLASQQMGELPSFRSEMLPSFSVTCMDLFGPYEIRDDCVKKGPRVFKKVYGVIFTCASTRAVQLDIAVDYSTESVLHCVRRLLGTRGDVRMMISDPGSQLVGASRELAEWRRGWDMEQLNRFGAARGLEWKTIMADSQHQNGVTEILVKLIKGVKKSLLHALGDTKLSLNEMNTLMVEIANLVNERPIGMKPNRRTDSEYLSPNSLLLGRCSTRISSGPFQPDQVFTDDPKDARNRFLLVQAITNQFWKVWLKIYFPTLIVQQKWHVEKRNLMVDDVCILKESNAFRGEWRLCKVSKVFPDRRGNVRNVQVMVKPKQGGSIYYVPTKAIYLDRHVSNLVVVVAADDEEHNEVQHEEGDEAQHDQDQGEALGELANGPQTN